MRVAPKGGKARGRKGAPLERAEAGGGKGSKWDPNGCARCGRSSHWAKECTAPKDVNGETPREKPEKKPKVKGRGKGLHDLEEEDEGTGKGQAEEEEENMALWADSDEDDMYVLEDEEEPNNIPYSAVFVPDPWSECDPWIKIAQKKKKTTTSPTINLRASFSNGDCISNGCSGDRSPTYHNFSGNYHHNDAQAKAVRLPESRTKCLAGSNHGI